MWSHFAQVVWEVNNELGHVAKIEPIGNGKALGEVPRWGNNTCLVLFNNGCWGWENDNGSVDCGNGGFSIDQFDIITSLLGINCEAVTQGVKDEFVGVVMDKGN